MPKIDLIIPHALAPDEAATRIRQLVQSVQSQYAGQVKNVRENWTGNQAEFSFELMGFSVSGTVSVETSAVHLTAKLPLAAMPFRAKVEQAIREKAQLLLA